MSGGVLAAQRRGGADGWLPLVSFATCTFYVFLVGFLALWVVVAALVMRWDPMVVTSGSMAPLIRTGDVVLTGEHDGADLDAGTVITYRDASRGGALVTHRIAAVNEDGTYTTRGDSNQSTDPTAVRPDDVEGVGRLLVPMIGVPVAWLAGGNLAIFGLWAVMTAIAGAIAARPPDADGSDGRDRPAGGAGPATRTAAWRPAVAGVAIVALLGLYVVPRSAAVFTASAANTGNSWRSSTWAATAPTDIALPSCTRERGDLAVVLSWQPPIGPEPDGYVVQQAAGDPAGPYTDIATVPEATYDFAIDGLTNNVWYFYRVRSQVGALTSDPSPAVGVRVRGQVCETQ